MTVQMLGSVRRAACAVAFLGAVVFASPAQAALVSVDSVGDSFPRRLRRQHRHAGRG